MDDTISSFEALSSSLPASSCSITDWRYSRVDASSCLSPSSVAAYAGPFEGTRSTSTRMARSLNSTEKKRASERGTANGITSISTESFVLPASLVTTVARARLPVARASSIARRRGTRSSSRAIRRRSSVAVPGAGSRKGAISPRNSTMARSSLTTTPTGATAARIVRSASLRTSPAFAARSARGEAIADGDHPRPSPKSNDGRMGAGARA